MRIHHIGIASENLERSIRNHEALFNMHPVTDIVEDPVQKVSVVMLSDTKGKGVPIELISPLDDESPVSNIVKKGIRLYHLCFTVENIESALKKAREAGALVISGPSPAKLYGGRKIAFIYTPDGYLVEFLEES